MNPHESDLRRSAYVKPTPALEPGTLSLEGRAATALLARHRLPPLAQPRFGGGVIRQARRLTVAFREGDEPATDPRYRSACDRRIEAEADLTLRAVFMHVTTAAPLELMPGTPPQGYPLDSASCRDSLI